MWLCLSPPCYPPPPIMHRGFTSSPSVVRWKGSGLKSGFLVSLGKSGAGIPGPECLCGDKRLEWSRVILQRCACTSYSPGLSGVAAWPLQPWGFPFLNLVNIIPSFLPSSTRCKFSQSEWQSHHTVITCFNITLKKYILSFFLSVFYTWPVLNKFLFP